MTLSLRQSECVSWIAAGKTAAEIGIILSISQRTVRYHLDLAREKLDASNLCELVAKAIDQKEITRP